MSSRHRSRERALQILYLWDMRKGAVEESIETFYSPLSTEDGELLEQDGFTERLARGVADHHQEIDGRILEQSSNWRLERMPVVDRNILRLAVYEIMWEETPHAVAIDEALELARRFSNEESVAFINGVLDAVRKHLESSREAVDP
jgi:N utilization substance protein B